MDKIDINARFSRALGRYPQGHVPYLPQPQQGIRKAGALRHF